MKIRILCALGAAAAAGALAAQPAGEARVMDAAALENVFVINGQPVRMEIAPDAPGSPAVGVEAATRLGLEGSMVGGISVVGTTRVHFASNLVSIAAPDQPAAKRRLFFLDRPWVGAGEGQVSPQIFAAPVFTWRLRPAQLGETTIVLPLIEHERSGIFSTLTVGDQVIPVVFTFRRAETMANAQAGAMLTQALGGAMSGAARTMAISYGIERPVRALDLAQPLTLGGLPIGNLVVRTGDTGTTAAIPDADTPRDPGEIVVTGGKGKPSPRLWIGTDALKPCSTLTFDRATSEIRLTCTLPDAGAALSTR